MGQQAKKNFPMGYLSPIKKKTLAARDVGSRLGRAFSLPLRCFPAGQETSLHILCVVLPKGVPAIGFRGNRVMNFSVASGLGEALPSLLASLFRAVYAFRVTWSERFSSRIRHRNELTEKAWKDAVQGLGKGRQGGAQE